MHVSGAFRTHLNSERCRRKAEEDCVGVRKKEPSLHRAKVIVIRMMMIAVLFHLKVSDEGVRTSGEGTALYNSYHYVYLI